jgi:hypothetical protein
MQRIPRLAVLSTSMCLVILALVLSSAADCPVAYACSCGEEWSATEALTNHSAVFSANVVAVEDDATSPIMRKKVTLQVLESWKGVTMSEVVLYTGIGRGDCGFAFSAGARYLVFGGWDRNGDLGTGICTRTKLLEDAASDLSELGQPSITIQT